MQPWESFSMKQLIFSAKQTIKQMPSECFPLSFDRKSIQFLATVSILVFGSYQITQFRKYTIQFARIASFG
jgi:hypothetical protein